MVGGRWKPLHYLYARALFADVMATCGGDGTCYIKNDRASKPFRGTVTLETLGFADGVVTQIQSTNISLSAGPGVSHYFHAQNLSMVSGTTHLLLATVHDDEADGEVDATLSVNEIPLVPPAAMQLPNAVVTLKVAAVGNPDGTFNVTLSANATALYVTLTTRAHGRFSDNFFAMSKGTRTVTFLPFSTFVASTLEPSLRVEHLQMYL